MSNAPTPEQKHAAHLCALGLMVAARNAVADVVNREEAKRPAATPLDGEWGDTLRRLLLARDNEGLARHLDPDINIPQTIADDFKFEPLDCLVFMGYGPHVDLICKRTTKENVVVIYDPSPIIYKPPVNRYHIITSSDEQEWLKIFRTNPEIILTRIKYCFYYPRKSSQTDRAFKSCARAIQSGVITHRTTVCLARISTENILRNFAEYLRWPGLVNLRDKYKDKPGIVLAAGPSLSRHYETLRKYQDRAIYMAVTRVLRVLQAENIRAHFTTMIDYSPINKKHFEDVSHTVPLILDPQANWQTVRDYHGPKISIDNPIFRDMAPEVPDKQFLFTGATVAYAAAKHLLNMGCSPVIFIGQDMCFTDDKIHVDGTAQTNAKPGLEGVQKELIRATDRFGHPVWTTDIFQSYRQDLEGLAKENPGKFINCTEAGMNLDGMPNRDLASVLSDVATPIEPYVPVPEPTTHRAVDTIDRLLKQADELRSIYDVMLGRLRTIQNRAEHGKYNHPFGDELKKLGTEQEKYAHLIALILNVRRAETLIASRVDRLYSTRPAHPEDIKEGTPEADMYLLNIDRDYKAFSGNYYALEWVVERLKSMKEDLS